ncbi:MAG: hypothetical protein FWC60_03730 [Firmicutes bacterium]|nr:hypothetical protein [Bacillota bacterium]
MFPLRKGIAQRRLSLLMALVLLLMAAFAFTPVLQPAQAADPVAAAGGSSGGGGGVTHYSFAGGNGTSADPFIIATSEQLAQLASEVNSGTVSSEVYYYRLGNTIDLSSPINYSSGQGWIPIGTGDNPFRGHFDGAGYTISGLFINTPDIDYVGLFGYISGSTAAVKNLNVSVTNVVGGYSVGGVAGCIDGGSVTDCTVTGPISGVAGVGGIAGDVLDGSVANCDVTGTVSGTDIFLGGVAGYVDGGSVTNCTVTGPISGRADVGGIAGCVLYGSVTNCNVNGAVSGTDAFIGGVAGEAVYTDVTSCNITGPVTGVYVVGGVAAEVFSGSVTNCYVSGAVKSASVVSDLGYDASYVGGVAGEVFGANVSG